MTKIPGIILASTSPRRQELLRQINVEFEVVAPHVDESPLLGEKPADLVKRLALAKARSVIEKVWRRHLVCDDPKGKVEQDWRTGTPKTASGQASTPRLQPTPNKQGRGIVLGVDTVVVLDGAMLGKPADAAEAHAMLRRLSGRTHTVYTGFALINSGSGKMINSCETADVTFKQLRDEEIAAYVATGSPLDKAGAYGIQNDLSAGFIEKISGDVNTVIGLPLASVQKALREMV